MLNVRNCIQFWKIIHWMYRNMNIQCTQIWKKKNQYFLYSLKNVYIHKWVYSMYTFFWKMYIILYIHWKNMYVKWIEFGTFFENVYVEYTEMCIFNVHTFKILHYFVYYFKFCDRWMYKIWYILWKLIIANSTSY